MSLFLGTIYSTLELDTNSLAGQTKKAKQQLSGVADAADNVGKTGENSFMRLVKASALGNLAAIGLSKGIASITDAAKEAAKSLTELENSRASFEVLTGSAARASIVMGELANYANNTPFEFGEVARAGKTLLGFGVTADKVGGYVKQLGDVVGATGGDFYSAARVFGQISAAGRIMAEDYNQLIDNGIALGDVLANELGIPMSDLKDKMSEGAVTSEVFYKALEKATSEGGKFFGGADKLAQTLNGRISTLTDTFTGLVGTVVGVDFKSGIVQADGLYAKFRDTILQVNNVLGQEGTAKMLANVRDEAISFAKSVVGIGRDVYSYLQPALSSLWLVITSQVVPAFMSIVSSPIVAFLGQALVFALRTVIDTTTWLLGVLAPFGAWFVNNTPLIITLVAALAGYKLAVIAITAVQTAQNAVAMLTQTRYMMLNGTLVAVRTATIAQTVAQAGLNAVMNLAGGPIGLLVGGIAAIVAGFVYYSSTTERAKSSTQRLMDAQMAAKAAGDQLKTTTDELAGAQVTLEGANLRVERAQKSYNDAVTQYGKDSLEAREAEYNLKLAKDDQTKANDKVTESTKKMKEEQIDATAKELLATEMAENHKRGLDKVKTGMDAQNDTLDKLGLKLDNLNGKKATATIEVQTKYTTNGPYSPEVLSRMNELRGKYSGGPVKKNTPYIVGENRDGSLNKTSELFIPGKSGSIVNSSQLQSMLRGNSGAPTGTPTAPSLTASAFTDNNNQDDGTVFSGNTFHITMEGVNDPDEFAKELKLAFQGR